MLLRETGQYLFEHTVLNLQAAAVVDHVLLATDSDEIIQAAAGCGIDAVMTDEAHKSGTDRVHEAYGHLQSKTRQQYDVILNVQGDEPELSPSDLRRLIDAFQDPAVEFASLWVPIQDRSEAESPNAVKVVLDEHGDALYFSRACIPNGVHQRDSDEQAIAYKRHIGVYAFRPTSLKRFCALAPGTLERIENLEQLRWLESGERLRVLQATKAPRGIDTLEDYLAFVERQSQPS